MVKVSGILEIVLYADDLEAAQSFYTQVLGLALYAKVPGRHVFFRCGDQMLLIFNPDATNRTPAVGARPPVPPHGARGPGHLCFRASAAEIDDWRERLKTHGVAIETEFEWPEGGRSLYFRDPAGNSVEFAEPRIWGLT